MELDDFKQTWQSSQIKIKSKQEIMELIHNKSNGPVEALKRSFKKQIMLMGFMPLLIIATNFSNIDGILRSIIFWSYVAFCIAFVIYSYYNYLIVRRMEGMDGMVKTNLEEKIALLEKRLQWNAIGLRLVLLFFIILVEIVPYFQHYRLLEIWQSVHHVARVATYMLLFIIQYYAFRKASQHKFGNHIDYLKKLISHM